MENENKEINKEIEIKSGKVCPYCSNPTDYVDSQEIYRTKSYGMVYLCRPCSAYVGVHKGTDKALGRLANAELRKAKMDAHFWFDQIAKTEAGVINSVWTEFVKGTSNRAKAYLWLSKMLGIHADDCHIGMFDEEMCKRVMEVSKKAIENYGYGMPTRPPVNKIDEEFFK
jgi:DNA-directed RNA polymerase subunit RPC12/RpoP